MRLCKIARRKILHDGVFITYLVVVFVNNGIEVSLPLTPPDNFDAMTRAEKISWGKAQIVGYLSSTNLVSHDGEIFFPNSVAKELAADDFENLPGWATWTAAEAEAWIETNVTNLSTAKTAIKAMAKAIIYFRDVTIPK